MSKPPYRASLIEALTMSCAEIKERQAKYEAMSDEEWERMMLPKLAEAAQRRQEPPETVQVSKLLWDAAQASAAQDRARLAVMAEQIEALKAEVHRLQQTVAATCRSHLAGLPTNALRHSR